jgi:hypothetical protein
MPLQARERAGGEVAAGIRGHDLHQSALRRAARRRGEAAHGVDIAGGAERLLIGAGRRRAIAEGRGVREILAWNGADGTPLAPATEALLPMAAPFDPVTVLPFPITMALVAFTVLPEPNTEEPAALAVPATVCWTRSPGYCRQSLRCCHR